MKARKTSVDKRYQGHSLLNESRSFILASESAVTK